MGVSNRIRVGLTCAVVAALAALAFPVAASATPVSYTFDSDRQGWGQSQSGTLFSDAVWCAGTICDTDTVADGPAGNFTYGSPNLSNISANYGGTWSFELNSSVAPTRAPVVTIEDLATSDIAFLNTSTIGSVGETRHSGLFTEAGWQFCPFTMGCAPATRAQFQGMLASLVFFKLDVDVASGTGEGYALDNFRITDPPPPTPPPTQTQPPAAGPTGQRAAALKKCAKVKNKAKKKKCKKPARSLPV